MVLYGRNTCDKVPVDWVGNGTYWFWAGWLLGYLGGGFVWGSIIWIIGVRIAATKYSSNMLWRRLKIYLLKNCFRDSNNISIEIHQLKLRESKKE